MAMEFLLVTPRGVLFRGEAEMVVAKGVLGELGILPGHIPFTTRLEPGPVRIRLPQDQGERRFQLSGGTLQVDERGQRVLVLAEEAEEVT